MNESRRFLDDKLSRKSLLYAFQMLTPGDQPITRELIRTQLKKQELYDEFRSALQLVCAFYKDIPNIWTSERWEEVIQAEEVTTYLFNQCSPTTQSSLDQAECIFQLKPPLRKIPSRRYKEAMEVEYINH